MDSKTNEILQKFSKQKVDLNSVKEIKKIIQNIERELKGEENLYRSFQKVFEQTTTLDSEIIQLTAKRDKLKKPYKNIIPKIKKALSELNKTLNNTEADAKKTLDKLEDLGIKTKDIDLSKINELKERIKKLNFGFLDELPF